jgi:hypothetical protein
MSQVLSMLAGLGLYPAIALAIITPGFIRSWLEAVTHLDGAGIEPRQDPPRFKPGWMGC